MAAEYITVDIHFQNSVAYGVTVARVVTGPTTGKLLDLLPAGPNPPKFIGNSAVVAVIERSQLQDD